MNFRVRVPATTSNVGPGFDCFGMAVTMYLEVEVRIGERFEVTAEGAEVPLDKTNLVVRTFLDRLDTDATVPPFSMHLRNGIPLARGLGSSASARVAGVAIAEAWSKRSLEIDRAKVAAVATELEHHPDNATPAVLGGFCVSAGAAGFERLEMRDRPYLVVVPELEIHTEQARAALPKAATLEDAVFNLQRAALATARIAKSGDLASAAPFEDRLHQRYRLALEPRLQRAFDALGDVATIQSRFLSGSGPTVFVIPNDDRAAQDAERAFESVGLRARSHVVHVDNDGLQLFDLE